MQIRFTQNFGSHARDTLVDYPEDVARKLVSVGVAEFPGDTPPPVEKNTQYTADKVVKRRMVRKSV